MMTPKTSSDRQGPAGAALVLAGMALLLAACAQTPKPAPIVAAAPPPPTTTQAGAAAAPGLAPRQRLSRAVDLLGAGQPAQARAELAQLLAERPRSAAGRKLLDQIDREPRAVLGERNYPYKVRPGETMSALADRFLGDPILFYALARYNGIDAPAQMAAGQTLLIPGVPKKQAPARQPARAGDAAPTAARNTARADQLRAMALEDMNQGAIGRAVARLRLATTSDPDNAAIKRDLDRALLIQAAVSGQ